MKSTVGKLISSVIAFAAGVTAGVLIAPKTGKENRKWVAAHTEDARSWVEAKGQRFLDVSEGRIRKISEGVKNAIPDLYEATEDMLFEEEHIDQDE